MEGWIDRHTDRWMNGQTVIHTAGCIDGLDMQSISYGWMNRQRWMDRYLYRCIQTRIQIYKDRRIDGWPDRLTNIYEWMDGQTIQL